MTASELTGAAAPPSAAHSASRRAAAVGLFVLLLVSLAARTYFAVWDLPFYDVVVRYDEVRAAGGAYWPMHLYLGGPGYAVSWAVTAVFVVLLADGRGRVLNLVGALLSGVGGILFALAITAEVLPFAYAADPAVLPEPEGRLLFDTLNAQPGLTVPAIVGAQIAISVGMLVALVGMLVSKAVPRWLSIAGIVYSIVYSVGSAALPTGPYVAASAYLVQVVLVAVIGWYGLMTTRARW